MRRLLLLLALPLSACSCGEDPSSPGPTDAGDTGTDGGVMPPPGTVALEIDPSDIELVIDGTTPAAQSFRVDALDEDGKRTDVSAQAAFTLSDGELGSMNGATFTSGLAGGSTTLTARLGEFEATARIRVVVRRIVEVPGGEPLPNDPGSVFQGAPDDPSRAPAVVYPNDGVLLPVNLGTIEIHYRPGRDNTLFEIRFESPAAEIIAYARCETLGDGCLYTPDPAVWRSLAETNRGIDPVQIVVRGTDDDGNGRGSSAPIEMSFSAVRVDGGLYYWTTDGGRIMRVDFGAGQNPEQFYPFDDSNTCYGCHAVSRNGRRMTLSRSGQRDGRLTILDIGSQDILLQDDDGKREQFQSWDPTSTFFAGVWSDGPAPDTDIRIRDGRTGDVVETIDLDVEPDHPDWSPRGDRILFTVVTHHQTSQRPGRGGIAYVEEVPGGGWSDPMQLIAPEDGKNRYYPAYSPDAAFFLYCESTCPPGVTYDGSCDADADPSAKLWAMSSQGGAPIYLARASGPGVEDSGETELSNTFPKWAPFVDPRRRDGTGRLMWFTFSSRRRYGLRAPNGSDQWLWMAAIDPDAVGRGEDGSAPAFALPFQDLSTSNHIAQWTTTIVPTMPNPSDGGIDPPNGSDGGSCTVTGDPCDPSASDCCAGTTCAENGPGIYVCRPDL